MKMEWFLENERELFIVAILLILTLFALLHVFIAWVMFKPEENDRH